MIYLTCYLLYHIAVDVFLTLMWRFKANEKALFKDRTYYVAILITPLIVPLIILALPYFFYDNKRIKKEHKEWDEEQRLKEDKRQKELICFLNKLEISTRKKSSIKNTNEPNKYVDVQKEFLNILPQSRLSIMRRIHTDDENFDYNDYSYCLKPFNCLKLKEGYKLGIRFSEDHGCGDHSDLYIYNNDIKKDTDVFKYIDVEWSDMGVWQAYILDRCWHKLPVFWHGLYDSWAFVYNSNDLEDIRKVLIHSKDDFAMKPLEWKPLEENYDLCPTVLLKNDHQAFVRCYHWQEFGGLIYEDALIEKNDEKIEVTKLQSLCEYSYSPGYIL